jgi:hypothetical protein
LLDSSYARLTTLQRLQREWRPHLNIGERDFLAYLLDNTVCYGRDWLKATVDQMIAGTDWLPRIGMAKRSIYRVVESLKTRGLLTVKMLARRVPCFIVNLKWSPAVSIPISKKQAERMAAREAGLSPGAPESEEKFSANLAMNPPFQCQIGSPKKDSIQENDSTTAAARGGGVRGEDVINEIRARKAKPKKADKDAKLRTVWRDAHAEAFPGRISPLLSVKELGMLSRIRDRYPADGAELIQWSVINWRQIIAERFDWMTRSPPPEMPNVQFLLGQVTSFAEAFATDRHAAAVALMPDEAREYHQFRDSGLSHDDTLLEIGKRRALQVERGKIAHDRADVERLYRALALDRAAARQQPVQYGGPAVEPAAPVEHGDNPWETGADVDLPQFGEWEGE